MAGTYVVSASLSPADHAAAAAFIEQDSIRMSMSAFLRTGLRLLSSLPPERFIELELFKGVDKAVALLTGAPVAEGLGVTVEMPASGKDDAHDDR